LGQLQFAKEPAGKLRTFAMLDVITQTVMTPLHDIIFCKFCNAKVPSNKPIELIIGD